MRAKSQKVRILDFPSIRAKLKRIAYEIYESNFGEEELVIAGIHFRGGYVAQSLVTYLESISPLKVQYISLQKEGASPKSVKNGGQGKNEIVLTPEFGKLIEGKTVVVVDDVLYSGYTLFRAIAEVMAHKPAKVQSAVLIDRGHRSVSVFPDFVGLDLATTLKQHVYVEVSPDRDFSEVFIQ